MKLELTGEEAARLMAAHYAMKMIQAEIASLHTLHNRHVSQREEIVRQIRKRVKGLPKTPITEWVFRVDPVTFAGHVEIPDRKEKQ